MIWLRLFIAVIALTISSDLSAWAQTQVNSPEGFYDCKGFANGANVRDIEGGCCLPSEQTEATHCRRCRGKIGCEPQNGCGNDAQAECGGCNLGNTAASYACGGCGDNTSCLSGCDNKPYSTKTTVCGVCDGSFNACGDCSTTDQGCGCGQLAPGPCGCSACPPPPASCNQAPVKFSNRNLISLHFGTGNNDSNGVLSDGPQYREICKNALGASSYDAVVYYDIHEAKFSSPGNNSICSYKPNSSTEKHCVNAKNVGNPKHISQISCRCN